MTSNGKRKLEHLLLASQPTAIGKISAGWDDVHLVPCALPEISMSDVDLTTKFLNTSLNFPIMIAGMTGGCELGGQVNRNLAIAAQEAGIAMGVGSQREALENSDFVETFAIARREAPDAFLVSNIGITQIPGVSESSLKLDQIRYAIDMIEANAIAVHLNFIQESIQPEGDRRFKHGFESLAAFVEQIGVPVITKETGCGVVRKTAEKLVQCGVAAIDVGGAGGTSFSAIETMRAANSGHSTSERMGIAFANWGASTAASTWECTNLNIPVIATGGLRNGHDTLKAICLGASLAGFGRIMLEPAKQSADAVLTTVTEIAEQLRMGCFLMDARTPIAARKNPAVLTGFLKDWIDQRKA